MARSGVVVEEVQRAFPNDLATDLDNEPGLVVLRFRGTLVEAGLERGQRGRQRPLVASPMLDREIVLHLPERPKIVPLDPTQ